jgi:acetylornithine aminotransferase
MIDEVQSGLCRTGKWFGFQHSSISPDVVTVAKALGNGIPIGACLARNSAAEVLTPGSHGSTFGGNFLTTTVAIKVLDIMKQQNLCENARIMGKYFEEQLNKSLNKNLIKEIRCKGLMIGIELNIKCLHYVEAVFELGLVINVTKESIIRLLPPLIIDKIHVDKIIMLLTKLIRET